MVVGYHHFRKHPYRFSAFFFLVAIICGAFFEEKVNLSLYMCMMCTVLQLIQRIALILPFKLKGNERKPSPSMNPKH